MNIPISWLQEYIQIKSIKDFAHKMTMSGTKVEAVHNIGKNLKDIVVAKVIELIPHKNANLTITKVDIGTDVYQIITGAKNLKEGDFVPVALVGSVLEDGTVIQEMEFKGEVSQGMLCSIEELGGTTTDFPEAPENGIYIFNTPQKLGDSVCHLLQLKDSVVEFELTTNRPDCYSLTGIIREAKALGYPMWPNSLHHNTSSFFNKTDAVISMPNLKVTIQNTNSCLRYSACIIEDVKIAPSPQWLRRRLSLCGIRPRNNIVDITNYVMLELGQPLHAFDISNVTNGEIIIRNAKQGEQITTLDGVNHTLNDKNLVIADSYKPLAIAGIMGGKDSSINESTTNVILESANFYGSGIRNTSKNLGIRTDSSSRYEKGLDPNISLVALNRCIELIQQLNCGNNPKTYIDNYPNPLTESTLSYEPKNINKLLGTKISQHEMEKILNNLEISSKNNVVNVPTFRRDIEQEADIAEEIARIYGYDKIDFVTDNVTTIGTKNHYQLIEEKIITTAISLGLSQIMTYSFESPKVFDMLNIPLGHYLRNTINISNPLGENSIMKSTAVGGMLNSLAHNYNHRNMDVQLFEFSKVYTQGPLEELTITLGMYSKNTIDFFYIKGIVQEILNSINITVSYEQAADHPFMHPGRCANIIFNGNTIGFAGEVHPTVSNNYQIKERVYTASINIETLIPHISFLKLFSPLPKYPPVTRDIAFKIKKEINANQVEEIIKIHGTSLLSDIKLFDVYQGEQISVGYKSMAYSLVFRDKDRTLEDTEINSIIKNILMSLTSKLGAKLRG